MRAWFPIVVLVVVASCGSKEQTKEPSTEPSTEPSKDPSKGNGPSDPKPHGEVRGPIAFGDCAGPTVPWVSGPRPMPFTLEQADGVEAAGSSHYGEWDGTGRSDKGRRTQGGRIERGPDETYPWARIAATRYGGTSPPRHPDAQDHYREPGPRPEMSVGEPTVQGDLKKDDLVSDLPRAGFLHDCYKPELVARPDLAGTVETQFFIEPNGTVTGATASGVNPTVASCIASSIQGTVFRKPDRAARAQVNLRLVFRDEGVDAPTIPPNTSEGIYGHRYLFRDDVVDTTQYVPGVTNPLRGEESALTECFRTHPKHHGAAVVTLTYDTGGVASATTHGLDDDRVSACVIAAAKRIKRAEPGPTAQRCSLAFGAMPVADLATIDITDSIRFNGKRLTDLDGITVTTAAIQKSEEPTIYALRGAVATRHVAIIEPDAPILTIHGPNVIRPLDTTPMKVVFRVVANVLATGDDLVLAARRGADWKLLRPMTFPVIPVPYGTGGRWNPIKGKGHGSWRGKARVTLSLVVTADKHVWIGSVNEFEDLEPDATQSDKLAAALKKHKVSAAFADRIDVEISGEEWATYGGVVRLIDAAEAAGFVDWRVTPGSGLVANPDKTGSR